MKLLAYLTELFVDTFGITRPKPEQQRIANLAIGGFLLAFALLVLSVLGFFFYEMTAGGK
jgi:hypothetical protein